MRICKFMFLGLIILFLAGCYVTPYGVYNLRAADERSSLLFSMFEVADSFTDKTDEERKEARKEQRDRDESEVIRTNNNNYNLKKMEKLWESFEVKSLRKTSLMPGQKLSGRVYFKVNGSIKEFSLNIPIKEDEFKIK